MIAVNVSQLKRWRNRAKVNKAARSAVLHRRKDGRVITKNMWSKSVQRGRTEECGGEMTEMRARVDLH